MGQSWKWLDIRQLSIPERLDLIAAIWKSIPEDESLPLPDCHREELDRRLADLQRNPATGLAYLGTK
jgi:putative addiction module component (TIGR02574 family)